jgi:hypothetical protein
MFSCRSLFTDSPIFLAAPDNFDKIVDGSRAALIEFYAPWW